MKQPEFKRGDKVVYLDLSSIGIKVTVAEVTATRKEPMVNGKFEHLVYVKSVTDNNYTWKRTFSDIASNRYGYGEKHPLWMLRHLTDGEFPQIKTAAERYSKLYGAYSEKCNEIDRQVEDEARKWKYAELDRRKAEVPHSWGWAMKQLSRLGFKQPKEKVKA